MKNMKQLGLADVWFQDFILSIDPWLGWLEMIAIQIAKLSNRLLVIKDEKTRQQKQEIVPSRNQFEYVSKHPSIIDATFSWIFLIRGPYQ